MDHSSDQTQVVHLALVSDSTGETVSSAVKAAVSQFAGCEAEIALYPFIGRPDDVDALPADLWQRADAVVYTLVRSDTRERLEDRCRSAGLPFVPLLDALVLELARLFDTSPSSRPGQQYVLGPQYLERIGAIEYAIAHDDGMSVDHLLAADVILTGVSRTSKTPTCVYLAYQGIKAANVPLLPEQDPPGTLMQALEAGIPVIGLTASAARLMQVRQIRLERLGHADHNDYANARAIEQELVQALMFFDRHHIPVIDVTRRSIEETAASVRSLLRDWGKG